MGRSVILIPKGEFLMPSDIFWYPGMISSRPATLLCCWARLLWYPAWFCDGPGCSDAVRARITPLCVRFRDAGLRPVEWSRANGKFASGSTPQRREGRRGEWWMARCSSGEKKKSRIAPALLGDKVIYAFTEALRRVTRPTILRCSNLVTSKTFLPTLNEQRNLKQLDD